MNVPDYDRIPGSAAVAMPADLRSYLRELEAWGAWESHHARKDAIAFWILKVPAMVAAACAGLFAYFSLQAIGIFTGALATLFILIDSVHPRGMLRNIHMRAFHEIRMLINRIVTAWRTRSGRAIPENHAAGSSGNMTRKSTELPSTFVTPKPR